MKNYYEQNAAPLYSVKCMQASSQWCSAKWRAEDHTLESLGQIKIK